MGRSALWSFRLGRHYKTWAQFLGTMMLLRARGNVLIFLKSEFKNKPLGQRKCNNTQYSNLRISRSIIIIFNISYKRKGTWRQKELKALGSKVALPFASWMQGTLRPWGGCKAAVGGAWVPDYGVQESCLWTRNIQLPSGNRFKISSLEMTNLLKYSSIPYFIFLGNTVWGYSLMTTQSEEGHRRKLNLSWAWQLRYWLSWNAPCFHYLHNENKASL